MKHQFFYLAVYILLLSAGCNRQSVIYPQRKEIIETVYASGKIISENEYNVFAIANGTIVQKLVKDGDTVKKGQLLYIIRNEAAKQKLAAAQSNYEIATTNLSENSPLLNDLRLSLQNAQVRARNDSLLYFRWKNLWEQNIGARNNLDNTFTNYQVSLNQEKIAGQKYNSALNDIRLNHSNAQSQLAASQKDLDDLFIKSDRDAVVYQTFKEAGEAVHGNEVVALLGEPGNRIIRLAVDQQDINRIKTGQDVLLEAEVSGDIIYEATVTRIYPVMSETDQTFRVDAQFKKATAQPFIHSSVEANIIIQRKKDALILPREVLTVGDSLWVRTTKSEKKSGIRVGITTAYYIEVLSGIDEKTPVLITSKANGK